MNLLLTVVAIALLGAVAGLLLGGASLYCKERDDPIVTSIDTLLPQSQCGQCGYPGCLPYATAVAKGEAIDKCVPGGREVIIAIANLLNKEPPPQVDDPTAALSVSPTPENKVALIDESNCIGCTKCLQVCPVDAIIGTTKAMHTVLNAYCTGCTLCVAPCPTQCIQMVAVEYVAEQQLLDDIAASVPSAKSTVYVNPYLSANTSST